MGIISNRTPVLLLTGFGEQERAQRDYRLALAGGAGDEVRRRYALSLGISGRPSRFRSEPTYTAA